MERYDLKKLRHMLGMSNREVTEQDPRFSAEDTYEFLRNNENTETTDDAEIVLRDQMLKEEMPEARRKMLQNELLDRFTIKEK